LGLLGRRLEEALNDLGHLRQGLGFPEKGISAEASRFIFHFR
jgi:hypothetical protein